MAKLTDSTRLKIKGDTFFFPDSETSVYFRNNSSSFRMNGGSIVQWVERLVPMFNGQRTLAELTQGLPPQYQNRVYEIGEALYLNGFASDVSQNQRHHLEGALLEKYASQIGFIENFIGSGAYRFQLYRQTKVLVVGSGLLVDSLVSSLLESGIPKIDFVRTDRVANDQERLKERVERAVKDDSEVEVSEISPEESGSSIWKDLIEPYAWVLFGSENGKIAELRALHAACQEEKKKFIPVIGLQQMGIVGPVVHPDSKGDWESAWHRVNQAALSKKKQNQLVSVTASAVLANVTTFEFFKIVTGVTESEEQNQFFLLDLETLEGDWHSFLPHPLLNKDHESPRLVHDLALLLKEETSVRKSPDLLSHFDQITSDVSGIFHKWEEGDLRQLPLAQCRVQVTDPLSEGPTKWLARVVCSGLTHEEAQREAGLTGIEIYMERLKAFYAANSEDPEMRRILSQEFIGIGTGETRAEAVSRGLLKCLEVELEKQMNRYHENSLTMVHLGAVEDEHCRYYLQVLRTVSSELVICLGDKVWGFPVVWVGTNGGWSGNVGLTQTMALRKALQQANMKLQNPAITNELDLSAHISKHMLRLSLDIPASKEEMPMNELQSALKTLKQNRQQLMVLEFPMEPFLKEKLVGAFGVVLWKEEFR